MYQERDTWTLSIFQNHDANASLFCNDNLVFSTLEERLSLGKHDAGLLHLVDQICKHTNHLDKVIFSATYPMFDKGDNPFGIRIDVVTDSLISRGLLEVDWSEGKLKNVEIRPYENFHHLVHGLGGFSKSPFDEALCVVIDGSGSGLFNHDLVNEILLEEYGSLNMMHLEYFFSHQGLSINEAESIYHFDRNRDKPVKVIRKQFGSEFSINEVRTRVQNMRYFRDEYFEQYIDVSDYDITMSPHLGIGKIYELASSMLKYDAYGVGKVMGLSCYGELSDDIPPIFDLNHIPKDGIPSVNGNLGRSVYPHVTPLVNRTLFEDVDFSTMDSEALADNQTIRNFCHHVQKETQEQALRLILHGLEKTGSNNVVVGGGYFMNVIANAYIKRELNKRGVNYFVDPVPNDSGMSLGAFGLDRLLDGEPFLQEETKTTYHGIDLGYTDSDITEIVENQEEFSVQDTTPEEIVELLCDQNIVAIYQGRSESSARALGNRSILFDPRVPNGKDIVNTVKMRESYRPFAGTILQDHAHEWFDMLDMEESPYMMYALDVNPEKKESIPAIVHVDDTCRIQTLTREYNPHYYDLIETFYEATGVPIIMNTSFNLSGDPIVETLENALSSLSRSKMQYLYLPEFGKLVVKN